MLGFGAAILVGVAIALLWMTIRNWNGGDSISSAATWQGKFGFPIAMMGLSLFMVELAVFLLWLRSGRIFVSLTIARVTAFVDWFSAGYRRGFDTRSSSLTFDTLNEVRHLVLANDSELVRIGIGQPEADLREIVRAFEETTGLTVADDNNPSPGRFHNTESAQTATVHIHNFSGALPRSNLRTILVLMMPFMVTLGMGLGMMQWASEHDPVVASRHADAKAENPRNGSRDSVFSDVLKLVTTAGALAFGVVLLRQVTAQSTIEISQAALSIKQGWRLKSISRNEVDGIMDVPNQLGKGVMRSVQISSQSRSTVIHPVLAPEEADWLVKWIQSKWPELKLKQE